MATIPDPKELEGRKEGQTPAPQSRDFFWDSITLYIVSAILALTAIDVVTEFVRGSKIQCYLPNETDSTFLANVQGYVNEFCAARLPSLQYLPALIAIHAILILAPHYVWLNSYGADLDFFFHHVSKLSRTPNPKTGDYPPINYTVSEQLEDAFSRSNGMYWSYLFIVFVQVCLCIGGILVSPLWLFKDREQGVPFDCPRDDDDTKGDRWPLPDYEKVICVVSSIHLLQKIWVVYLFLLAVAAIFLLVNMVIMMEWHTDELGTENRATFSFQTGISYDHYNPQPLKTASKNVTNALFSKPPIESKEPPPRRKRVWRRIKFVVYSLMDCVLHPFAPYSIGSNYDFLVVKLFRTDGGLAYVLREVHVLRLLRGENKSDRAKTYIYISPAGGSHEGNIDFLKADIGWKLPDKRPSHTMLFFDDSHLTLPRTMRGIVLGFSLRCEGSNTEHPQRRSTPKAHTMKKKADDLLELARAQKKLAEKQGEHSAQPKPGNQPRCKSPEEKAVMRAGAILEKAEDLAKRQSSLMSEKRCVDLRQKQITETERDVLQHVERVKQKFELIRTLMELEERKELGKSPVYEAKTVSKQTRETSAKVKENVSKHLKDLSEQVVQLLQGDIDVRSKRREFELEQERLDVEVQCLETEKAPLADGGTQLQGGGDRGTQPQGGGDGGTQPQGGGDEGTQPQGGGDGGTQPQGGGDRGTQPQGGGDGGTQPQGGGDGGTQPQGGGDGGTQPQGGGDEGTQPQGGGDGGTQPQGGGGGGTQPQGGGGGGTQPQGGGDGGTQLQGGGDGGTHPQGGGDGGTQPQGGGDGGDQLNILQLSYADLAKHLKKETESQLTIATEKIQNGQLEAEQLKLAEELSGKEFCGALCIGFDSESQGFASALARIFYRVGFINFSSHYKDYENPLRIDVNDASRILSVTTPHDILMQDDLLSYELPLDVKDKKTVTVYKKMSEKFLDDLNEVWKPHYISKKRDDDIRLEQREEAQREGIVLKDNWYRETDELSRYRTDYIVIGPLSDDFQVATVNKLLNKQKHNFSPHVVLLTIQPLQVGGKDVPFQEYTLPKEYKSTPLKVDVVDDDQKWPTQMRDFSLKTVKDTPFPVEAGGTRVRVKFTLYR